MDARALSVTLWVVVLVTLAGVVSHRQGLDRIQRSPWPSDTFTYDALHAETPDVLLLGSSRIAFGLSTDIVGACLGPPGDPLPTASLTVNHAAVFASAVALREAVARGGPPRLAVMEVGPSVVSAGFPMLAGSVREAARLADMGPCLAELPSTDCLRPLVSGIEGLGRFLGGRHRADAHSQWMMQFHGGGQFCFDGPACEESNRTIVRKLRRQWDNRSAELLPTLTADHFSDYTVGSGLNHRYLEAAIALAEAEGFPLVLLNMPVHSSYQEQVPADVDRLFRAYLTVLSASPAVTVLDANGMRQFAEQDVFIDPDHLRPSGTRRLSRYLCAQSRPLLAPR